MEVYFSVPLRDQFSWSSNFYWGQSRFSNFSSSWECSQRWAWGRLLDVLLLLLRRFSRVRLCATPQTAAHQAPPSLGFSKQEHWSGLPFPSPGDLPDPGIEPTSPALAADSVPPRYTLKWLSPELNVCVVRTERWSQKGKALAVIQSRCSIFCYFL